MPQPKSTDSENEMWDCSSKERIISYIQAQRLLCAKFTEML